MLMPYLFRRTACAALFALLATIGCSDEEPTPTLKISGSALGSEGEVLTRQIARFMTVNPGVRVEIQRTPDDATQRHQLYVQWLNAKVGRPDILQLDVVWTAEFAAAGWILPLDRFSPPRADFFPATLQANTWNGSIYALPWFVDVGILYRRTDLVPVAPASLDELVATAKVNRTSAPIGIAWQGARYEGLITVFVEYLGAFGGEIIDSKGRVRVAEAPAIRALTAMHDQLHRHAIAPREVLTWHEEETRFAFQNGNAVFMRNWPYAYPLLSDDKESAVAERFAISPMPPGPGGRPSATLGGAQLAINAATRHPDLAWKLIAFLTAPEQMLERAQIAGQYPSRRSVYQHAALGDALKADPVEIVKIVEAAIPRPVTPIYSELSEVLQIHLHRALAGQTSPDAALRAAAHEMERLVRQSGLRPTEAR